MKQFAIYYIPNNSDYYQDGAEIIGYDIITKRLTKPSKNKYIATAQELNKQSRKYGFHLTLTDVVDIDETNIVKALSRTQFIFYLPIFRDIMIDRDKIGLMPNANVLAIQFKNNFKLLLLHLLLICFVQRLGKKSYYSNKLSSLNFLRKIKTVLFLSPYIFDDFIPHITIAQNFPTRPPREIVENLVRPFKNSKNLVIDQISIVVKESKDSNFKILKVLGK